MAWPTWMPIAARPAFWDDWSTIFRSVIPREWPKRLFGGESNAYNDLVALGESLALARDMLSILQHNIWPTKDETDQLLTDRWEESFGIQASGTDSDRTNRLVAFMRQRGTMTSDLVKSIMCRAWGSDDPAIVTLISPTPGDVAAVAPTEDWQWADLQSQMHIYHTTEAEEPDYNLMEDLISKNKPTYENWSFGRYNAAKYEGSGGPEGGPGGGVGTYDHATYSP